MFGTGAKEAVEVCYWLMERWGDTIVKKCRTHLEKVCRPKPNGGLANSNTKELECCLQVDYSGHWVKRTNILQTLRCRC